MTARCGLFGGSSSKNQNSAYNYDKTYYRYDSLSLVVSSTWVVNRDDEPSPPNNDSKLSWEMLEKKADKSHDYRDRQERLKPAGECRRTPETVSGLNGRWWY
jgi:hypothetical protein